MDAQAFRDMLKSDLLFIVLPVVLGFTFNVLALYVILNADLIWQRIASARSTYRQREANARPATRPSATNGEPSD